MTLFRRRKQGRQPRGRIRVQTGLSPDSLDRVDS
jgi:hypothetical protein